MSRHRFVRNLDLDAELADDQPDDIYDDDYEGEAAGELSGSEEDDGMDETERAQMESALIVARERLKDIKPPVSDKDIRDSLWHYWFDVDKTVSWLRKEWEKKESPAERTPGDAGPPKELLPTPEQEPRPRPRRRRKLASNPAAPSPLAAPSLQPPLTALQRLSLARKQAASGSSSAAASPAPSSSAASSVPATRGSTPAPDAPAKPMSKLALLAQKRREAAAAKEASSSSASTAIPTPAVSPPPQPETKEAAPAKPLSKLAQKMAAARAARADAASRSAGDGSPAPSSAVPEAPAQAEEPENEMSALFSVVVPAKKAPGAPSTFFSLLTKPAVDVPPVQQPSLAHMHIAVRGDLAAAEQRVREAFGPGVESPDDVILRKQEGRVATAVAAPAEPKVVREVRVEKQVQEKPIESEVAAIQSQQPKPPSQPKPSDTKLRRHRSPTKKAESGPAKKSNAKPLAKDKAGAGGGKKATPDPNRPTPSQKSASNRGPKATPTSSKAKPSGKPKPSGP